MTEFQVERKSIMQGVQAGRIVRSRAGRDRDRFFVAVKVEDDFAYLCDGRLRPLGRPKKKRLRHLSLTSGCIEVAAISSDRQLRRLLEEYETDAESDKGTRPSV